MKTTCCSQLEKVLGPLEVDALARQTRFCRRTPKKLSPLTFIQSCCLLLLEKKVSYRRWAILIGGLINATYAKQSLFERMTERAVSFVQTLVLNLVGQLSRQCQRVLPPGLDSFQRVLVQDSTVLMLPAKLARFFPGGRNQHGSLGGMLRIQGLYDLKGGRFVHFSHSAFNTNDLTLADQILDHLRAGDLLLRDLGYLVLEVLRRIAQMKAFFLSRFKHNLQVYEPNGQLLNLSQLLSHRTRPLDKDALVGAKEQLAVRLVAVKVSEETANLRRYQARRDHHHPHPSKKHLLLLSWDLLITNVSQEQLSTKLPQGCQRLRRLDAVDPGQQS
jgi:hypothetical protein